MEFNKKGILGRAKEAAQQSTDILKVIRAIIPVIRIPVAM